jgi:hypothetical protein
MTQIHPILITQPLYNDISIWYLYDFVYLSIRKYFQTINRKKNSV